MTTITRQRLIELLHGINHSTFVGFTALTPVRAPVGAPVLFKLNRVNACIGSYSSAISRQRAREGNAEAYVSKPRKWGKAVALGLVQHEKDGALKHYLSAQVLHARDPIYLVQQPPLKPGRRPRLIGVDKAEIARWLPPSKTAEVAEAQGVAKAIVHRDYDLGNLSCVALGGQTYRIEG